MDITANANAGGIVGLFTDNTTTKGTVVNGYATGRIITYGTVATSVYAGGVIGSTTPNWTHLKGTFPNQILQKTSLNMSGLVALNNSVTSVNANRVAGKNGGSSGWQSALSDYGAPTLDSIVNCYALATLKVGAAEAETVITSTDASSIDGAGITAEQFTKNFLESIGWKFGTNAANPWVWINGEYPQLWFEITAKSVSLNKPDLSLAVDSTFQLVATVEPDVAINKNVSWHTSNDAVATVVDGLVTGTGEGSATITVTTEEGGHTATCVVTVFTETPEIAEIAIGGEVIGEISATDIYYANACGEDKTSVTIDATGNVRISVNGNSYTNGAAIPLANDKTTVSVEVSTSAETITRSLHIAKALGSASTPLFIQRWGATLAVINNPANNGGYTFDGYRWYNNGNSIAGETNGYILLNGQPAANYTADVHNTATDAWHKTCPNAMNATSTSISAYPNPVQAGQQVTIVLPQEVSSVTVRMIDINGNSVRTQKNVTSAVSAPAKPGIYLLQIQLPDGSVDIQKLIVE
jgi:hypothetical protein